MVVICDIDGCNEPIDVGESNVSLAACARCNNGHAVWNCLDVGTHSCDCSICKDEEVKK